MHPGDGGINPLGAHIDKPVQPATHKWLEGVQLMHIVHTAWECGMTVNNTRKWCTLHVWYQTSSDNGSWAKAHDMAGLGTWS